jgi:hypothetical protein
MAAIVLVPKTAMHEDNPPAGDEDEVGFPRKVFVM